MIFATILPLIMAADLNGGITNFGFSQTEAEEEYKIKPDYVSGNLFVANRQDLWRITISQLFKPKNPK